MSVAHRANIETKLSLNVTLFEELLHNAICPLTIEVQWLRRVTEVCAVDHVLKHLSTSPAFLRCITIYALVKLKCYKCKCSVLFALCGVAS